MCVKSNFLQLNSSSDFANFKFQTEAICLAAGDPTLDIITGVPVFPFVALVLGAMVAGVAVTQAQVTARDAKILNWDTKNCGIYFYFVANIGGKVRPLIMGNPAGSSRAVCWLCAIG